MFLPNEFTARLKMLRHRRARGFGAFRRKILFQWSLVLLFALAALFLVSAYSLYTFSYWYNIEDNLSASGEVAYDQAKLDKIFSEFDQKAVRAEELLNETGSVEMTNSEEVTPTE